jgi:hypothetical protein
MSLFLYLLGPSHVSCLSNMQKRKITLKTFGLVLVPVLALGLGIYTFDFHYLKAYYKSGFMPSNSFANTIQIEKDEVLIGFWDVPDRLLIAKKFKLGYYLVQKDPAGSYILPRGRNLLSDTRTIIKNKSFKISSIKSADSGLGGLLVPDNFPLTELNAAGYTKNAEGEWVKARLLRKSTVETFEGIVKYELPKSNNTTNWEQFQDLKLPSGILNVGGFGFPLFADEILQNGKVNLLSKGFTHVANLEGLPRNTWDGKNVYYFNTLFYLIKVAARNMLKQGKNGGVYGDIKVIADLEDQDSNIPYNKLTVEGAIELGRNLYYISCCANSVDDQSWNIPLNESVIMVDEESMHLYEWVGGNSYSLFGYLNQGMMDAAGPNYKVFWYAQPVSRHYQANILKGVNVLTKEDVENSFREEHIAMNSSGWKNSSWFTDANGGYSKVPFLSNAEIYEKSNGKIVLDRNGKRKYRNEDFSINIYGKPTRIYATPHEYMRYSLSHKNTGEGRFGRQYVDIHADGSASVKSEFKRLGYDWHYKGSRPYPQYWEPETKMWVEGIYRRADGIMYDLLMLSKLEKGKWDISKANVKYKLYGEHRPQTEPWTFGGNSIDVREVGESQIFYDTFMLLLSGGQAASSWDDGFWQRNLPKKGGKVYDKDDYWGRYHSKLAAVQTVMKPLEGSKSTDWTYVHFYYPFWGQKNSEVISSGIYFNGKFYVFFLNPTLESGEKQSLSLNVGKFSTSIELIGHEVYYKVFDVPQGLSTKDFKLSYTTIYGRKVKVNGSVTNKISEHYE